MSAEILKLTEEHAAYLHDESKTVGSADTISFPASEDEVRSILKHFHGARTPIYVQGNRTGLGAGAVPRGGHVMSLDRMCAVTGMSIENGCVLLRVQPGLSLGVLRGMIASGAFPTRGWDGESLEAYAAFKKLPRQYFPPDPTETSASIGGMVACNSSGAKTYRYGATRAFVSGVRMVLSDGDVLALRRGQVFADGRDFTLRTEGGRLISGRLPGYEMPRCKNAAGYYAADGMDMLEVLIGSDGTLGVITEIELRLIAQPKVIWGVNCFFDAESKAVDFVEALRGRIPCLAALEYFDGNALRILRSHDDGGLPVPEGFDCMVYAELHSGDEDEARDALRFIGRAMDGAGGDCGDTWCARSLHDRERLLELRHKVPESVNALIAERKRSIPTLAKVGSDMAVPDGCLRQVLEMYHSDLAKNGFEYAFWGHIGNNHLHVNVLPRSAEEMAAGKAMFAGWAEKIVPMGGTISAEHGAGKIKINLLKIMYGEQGLRQMAELKRVFDPECVLGLGNMFPADYIE